MIKTINTIWHILGYSTLPPPSRPYKQKTIGKHKRWESLIYLFVPFSCTHGQCEQWMSKLQERDDRSAIWSKIRRAKISNVRYRYLQSDVCHPNHSTTTRLIILDCTASEVVPMRMSLIFLVALYCTVHLFVDIAYICTVKSGSLRVHQFKIK